MSLFNTHTVSPIEGLFQITQADERIAQGSNTPKISPIEGLFQFSQADEPKAEEPKAAPAPTHPPPSVFSIGDFRAIFANKIAIECMLCLEVGKHGTGGCPYGDRVPKNARVGSACEIVCRSCGNLFFEGCCGLDEGRGIVKECFRCGVSGHWPETCPRNDGACTSTLFLFKGLAHARKIEESKLAAVASSSFTYSPDYHRSSSPGSKTEELRAEEPKVASASTHPPPFDFSIGDIRAIFANKTETVECMLCLEVGKHCTGGCPYEDRVPKNARVGSACEIVCRSCGNLFFEGCCGLDEGRGILKECFRCGASGHWPETCPRNDGACTNTLFLFKGLSHARKTEESKLGAAAASSSFTYSPVIGCKKEKPKDAPARAYPPPSCYSIADSGGFFSADFRG